MSLMIYVAIKSKIHFKILGLAVFLLFFLYFPLKALATGEFSTSYDVSYNIDEAGVADVTQKITLKNLTDKFYAENFIFSIGSTNLTDVFASDGGGVMQTKVENKDNKTSISVKFNQQITGIDKTQTINIKFKSKDFAQSVGKIWEVYLPKIPDSEDLTNYNLALIVPISFGDPTSITPKPNSQSQSFNNQTFIFEKNQLKDSGVSVNFGTFQIFDFNIKYSLENNSFFPNIQSIVIPSKNQYQDVVINHLSPLPSNVIIDGDGNYIAWYKVPGKSRIEAKTSGSVKLYLNTKNNILISKSDLSKYVKSDKYWEKDNPLIVATLAVIFKDGTPKTTVEQARLIYRYVVDNLKYDTNRLNNLERLGAITTLNNPNSVVCMEFTDLFITLSRAANIPARELDGFGFSQNQNLRPLSLSKNLLHAWPEYYDEQIGWVMVDPTWENTSGGVDYFNKFDLNHVVLATRGTSSLNPVLSEDSKVTISEKDFTPIKKIDINLDISDNLWTGFPSSLNITIKNNGNTALDPSKLSLITSKIKIIDSNSVILESIPPYGFATYKFDLRSSLNFNESTDNLEVKFAGENFTKKVTIKPIFMFIPWQYLLAIMLFIAISSYGIILFIHFRRKNTHKIV